MHGFARSRCALLASLLGLAATVSGADAQSATFTFGHQANHLNNAPAVQLTSAGVTMDLAAGPVGSGLNESNSDLGLGVDSTAVLQAGGLPTKFERLDGVSEFVEFSFDRAGVLEGLNFDGIKDESLEYFLLETAGGLRVNFFDSAANTTIPGAIDNAVALGAITGQVVYLLEDANYNDEAIGLGIPFAAGEVFRLTIYDVGGGLGAAFEPIDVPDGGRLQSIAVAIPEPAGVVLAACAAVGVAFLARRRRVKHETPRQ